MLTLFGAVESYTVTADVRLSRLNNGRFSYFHRRTSREGDFHENHLVVFRLANGRLTVTANGGVRASVATTGDDFAVSVEPTLDFVVVITITGFVAVTVRCGSVTTVRLPPFSRPVDTSLAAALATVPRPRRVRGVLSSARAGDDFFSDDHNVFQKGRLANVGFGSLLAVELRIPFSVDSIGPVTTGNQKKKKKNVDKRVIFFFKFLYFNRHVLSAINKCRTTRHAYLYY